MRNRATLHVRTIEEGIVLGRAMKHPRADRMYKDRRVALNINTKNDFTSRRVRTSIIEIMALDKEYLRGSCVARSLNEICLFV